MMTFSTLLTRRSAQALTRYLALGLTLWLVACAQTGPVRPDGGMPPSVAVGPVRASSGAAAPRQDPAIGLKPLSTTRLGSQNVHPLQPPTDLWDRIRRGFAMPDLDNDLVREREMWYSSRPDYVDRMTERGRKYLFYIVEELERRNMPSELALLPFIESAFNPQAVSSAQATGMWQFMPATGKTFELKQNMFRDDRRDVLASTRAALDYLQKLYGMFGDWQLALAAYNWGEGRVQKAVAKALQTGASTAYSDLSMPMETRFYVPKLQAVKNIVAAPESFRIKLSQIGNHPYFQTVDIVRDMDVRVAAGLAEVSLEDFKALNPSATKPVLLAAGTPQILLPWDNAERFIRNLAGYSGEPLATWTAWIAPVTMNCAQAAKRAGMSEAEFRSVNQIPPRMLIRAGSTLVVRRFAGVETDVTEHIADNGHLSLAPDVVLKKIMVRAGKKETVASLAQRFRVSRQSVAEWNKVEQAAAFKPGQSVMLYLPVRAAASLRNKTAPASHAVHSLPARTARRTARR